MKRILTTLSVAMLAGAAHAQSSVTLYGLLDVGLVYASNEHGSANYKMLSGTTQNDRWGLKVNEDLGGGLAAVATLENGFDLTSGKFQQGGREFGRQAYVGLSDKQYGTFLMGRQYDAMSDFLIPFSPTSSASSLAFHIGDNDNLNGGFRYSNSVKYVTPNVNGLRVEALYAFSNSPGAFGTNRAVSAGATYANGAFAAAVTYLNIDQPGTLNTNGARLATTTQVRLSNCSTLVHSTPQSA